MFAALSLDLVGYLKKAQREMSSLGTFSPEWFMVGAITKKSLLELSYGEPMEI